MALLEGLNARCWPLDQTRIQPQILHSGKHQEHRKRAPAATFLQVFESSEWLDFHVGSFIAAEVLSGIFPPKKGIPL